MQIQKQAILPRHKFHQKHFVVIGTIWIIVALLTAYFVIKTLYPLTIYLGLAIGFLVMLHFILLNLITTKVSPFIQKEIGIAFIYTVGIALPALSLSPFGLTFPVFLMLIQVFLLASVNLIEFSLFEVNEDAVEGQTSIVRAFGIKKTEVIIKGLLILNFIISMINAVFHPSFEIIVSESLLLVMNFALLFIFWKQDLFRNNENYRVLGDFIFILPGLLYFLI
jgi:4-hydroxybenzoate polyprenyltransferase